jgi:hypothetical protein
VSIFLARVSDVAFGMMATAQLCASFVTGFIRYRLDAANALGLILLQLIGPTLCLSIQFASMIAETGRLSCGTFLETWMSYARIVEQNRGTVNELIVVLLDQLWYLCKAMCLELFQN